MESSSKEPVVFPTATHESRIAAVEEGQKTLEGRLNVHDDAIHRLSEMSTSLERDIRSNGSQISRLDDAVNTLRTIADTVATKADITSLRTDVTNAFGNAHDSVPNRAVALFTAAIVAVALIGIAAVIVRNI